MVIRKEARCEGMQDSNSIRLDIGIVVLTFNNEKTISACLRSIVDQDYPHDSYQILVIDNGSTDYTLDIVRSFGISYVVLPKLTIGQLRNEGVRRTNAPVVGFIDSDCVVAADWISRVLQHFREESVAIAGCMYRLPPDPTFIERYWIGNPCPEVSGHRLIPAGNMAISKARFDEIGGFNERLISGEDVYLLDQARSHGYKTIYDPDIRNIHYGNPKTIADLYRKEVWYGIRGDSILRRFMSLDKAFIAAHLVFVLMILMVVGLVMRKVSMILAAVSGFLGLTLASALDRKYVKRMEGKLAYMIFCYSVYLFARTHSLLYLYGRRKYIYSKRG